MDHLPGSKMGLEDYISRERQQKAVNTSNYDEQFIVPKLYSIKRRAKRFLLNTEFYTNFAERNPLIKSDANILNFSDKLCSEIAPRNLEYSEITNNDNIISEVTPNYCHSFTTNETTQILASLFAYNCSTDQLKKHSSKFKRVANSFHRVIMTSQSDEETLSKIKKQHC